MFDKRINMLNTIDPKQDWESILYENSDNYLDFEKSFKDKRFDDAEAQLKELLPKYFDVVHRINEKHKKEEILPEFDKKPYDLGIFLVGYSIVPIILSVSEIRPKKIIFISSNDTKDLVDWILKGVNIISSDLENGYYNQIQNNCDNKEISDLSDPAYVYRFIEDIIKQNQNLQIAVDITGGKKTMVAGAFMSSALSKNCDIFYIDFEGYDPVERQPYYNTEFLIKLPNPSEIFSVYDWERLASLFNNYQYKEALTELERIKTSLDKNRQYFDKIITERIKILEQYVKAYLYWDDYNYLDALRYLNDNTLLLKLSKIENTYKNKFRELKRLYGNEKEADREAIKYCEKEVYKDKMLFILYIVDRFNNALRRYDQQQFQSAFLRIITLVEFVLTQWAENELHNREYSRLKNKYGDIPFAHLCSHLSKGRFKIVENINMSSLNKLRIIRNRHILIHSILTITENDFNDIANIFRTIIENLFTLNKLNPGDFTKLQKQLQFKKCKDIYD